MIYLDYNATTPIAPEVALAMEPYIKRQFGNPGSGHVVGMLANEAVGAARNRLSNLIGGNAGRIIFTGCATEANNLVIKGVAETLYDKGRHIITTAVEHPSVLAPLKYLIKYGWEVTFLPVDGHGLPDPDQMKDALREDTILVSVMHANNETGTILPVTQMASIARDRGILFHTDASQSMGKITVDVKELGVDFLTMAGHKFYAPKGIGALYAKNNTKLAPIIHGGGQEQGFRSGTENVVHIAAIGAAADLAKDQGHKEETEIRRLRDLLFDKISSEVEVQLLGHPTSRLPNTLNIAFVNCKGERILEDAPDVAASLGAACHDKNVTMSSVLEAMGTDPMVARGSIRLSLGRYTTEEEIDTAAELLIESAKIELRRN